MTNLNDELFPLIFSLLYHRLSFSSFTNRVFLYEGNFKGMVSHHRIPSILWKPYSSFFKGFSSKLLHFAACSDGAAAALEPGSVHIWLSKLQWLQLNSWQANSSKLQKLKEGWSLLNPLHAATFMLSTPSFVSRHVFEQTNCSGAS